MELQSIFIKNMVCPRCIKAVRNGLEALGKKVDNVELGIAKVEGPILEEEMDIIRQMLKEDGFELLEDKNNIVVEKVKTAIIELIYSGSIKSISINFSSYIAAKVGKDYHSISTVFSSTEGITIEKYFILQKIERAKELISYDDSSMGQIANGLGYSSIAHFSSQFKSIVGFSPSLYKKSNPGNRKTIDAI